MREFSDGEKKWDIFGPQKVYKYNKMIVMDTDNTCK